MSDPVAPTIGRIVHYRLSAVDVGEINRRRNGDPHSPSWPSGAQAHVGNYVNPGEVVPMIVAKVWGPDCINGQAILDGNDSLWVTSALLGDGERNWSWPPRV